MSCFIKKVFHIQRRKKIFTLLTTYLTMRPVILFKEIHVIMSIQSLDMFWQLTESKLTFGGQNKLFLSDTISIIEVLKEKFSGKKSTKSYMSV